MAAPKTQPTPESVDAFLDAQPGSRSEECRTLNRMMESATGSAGEMWGRAIVGYGRRMIPYANGKTQEWMVIGFSPRKAALTLYIPGGFEGRADLLERIGTHSCGQGCLYIKRLDAVNQEALVELIQVAVAEATAEPA